MLSTAPDTIVIAVDAPVVHTVACNAAAVHAAACVRYNTLACKDSFLR